MTSTSIKTTIENGYFKTTINGYDYGHGYNRIDDSLYHYNGFEITNIPTNIPTNNELGFVIGYVNNDPNNFLMMIVSREQTGSIYHINNGQNMGKVGNFLNIRNVVGVKINSLINKILSFDVITDVAHTRSYDLSSIEETITPCIGFTPFYQDKDTTINYKLDIFPYLTYQELDERITDLENQELDERITDLENQELDERITDLENPESDVLSYLQINGFNKGNILNIKLLGDSITAGFGGTNYNDQPQEGAKELFWGRYQNINGTCWANSLRDYAHSKYNNITIKNYGVSGANCHNLNQYFYTSNLVEQSDNVVIVMIGTNDRNGTKQNLYNELKSLYEKIKELNKKIIFMGNIPASVSDEENKTLHMEDINMIIESFCKEHNVKFISLYKLFIEYCKNTGVTIDSLLSDGLHPNDTGYNVMFELVSNELGIFTKRPGATW